MKAYWVRPQKLIFVYYEVTERSSMSNRKKNIYFGRVGRIGCDRRIGRNRFIGVIGVWGVVVKLGEIGV